MLFTYIEVLNLFFKTGPFICVCNLLFVNIHVVARTSFSDKKALLGDFPCRDNTTRIQLLSEALNSSPSNIAVM